MKKLAMFVAVFSVALAGAGLALAHNPSTGGDCDTWSRTAHYPNPTGSSSPSHHRIVHPGAANYDNLNDFKVNDFSGPDQALPNGTIIHQSSGHYVVQTGSGSGNVGNGTYVEVVGGGVYEGEPYLQNMGEGGYVQGRLDGNGTPATGHEADFHANTFGPVSEGSNALTHDSHAEACVSVDGQKQSVAHTVPCPVPAGTPDAIKCY